MIIGIHGTIQSGKDTAGGMIQYLTTPKDSNNFTLEDYLTDKSSYLYAGNNWEIKKFAGKLKDIICVILGCTRDQLEDIDFKNQELDKEWWYYKFQDKLYTLDEYKSLHKNQKEYLTLIKLTPRKILQLLGTEAGRQIIHPNIWINALFADYKEHKPKFHPGTLNVENAYRHSFCSVCRTAYIGYKRQFICKKCGDEANWYPNWIITDCRYENEVEAVKNRGGILISLTRNRAEEGHTSETALNNYEGFDYIIDNSGEDSLEILFEKLKEILIKLKN